MRITYQDVHASLAAALEFAKRQDSKAVVITFSPDGREKWVWGVSRSIPGAMRQVDDAIRERLDANEGDEDEYTVPAWRYNSREQTLELEAIGGEFTLTLATITD